MILLHTKQSKPPFSQWKKGRPFWGALLSFFSGLIILWVPIQLSIIAFVPGSFAFIGLLFGGLIVTLGLLAFIYPNASTIFGVFIILLSILSVIGALGGFLIGTLLGIVGGALCIGWQMEDTKAKQPVDSAR